jgi:orotidine-5'-phosphate decarboxylase
MAQRSGLDGVVASAREAASIRAACGPDFLIVTPGIRPAWHGTDDQLRTVTPAEAIDLGSDILVVGRPITRAAAPAAAARRIVAEMAGVTEPRQETLGQKSGLSS